MNALLVIKNASLDKLSSNQKDDVDASHDVYEAKRYSRTTDK